MKSKFKILRSIPFVIVIAILSTIIIYTTFNTSKNNIDAVNGRLDLNNWDFQEQGILSLKGDWEFYYNQLLSPEDFKSDAVNNPKLTGYIKVPSSWNGVVGNQKLEGKGSGTYRLIIKLKPYQQLFGIRISNAKMASKLFINGNLYGQSGKVGYTYEDYQAENLQYLGYFKNNSDKLEIIIQVSNYDFQLGGISRDVHLGLQEDIRLLDILLNMLELSAVVIVLLLSVQYLSIYYIRREDKSFLYASIYFVLLATMIATNGEKVLFEVFSSIPFEITRKIQGYSSNLGIIPLAYFFRNIKKELVSDKFIKLIYIIFIPYGIMITFCRYYLYMYLQSTMFFILSIFMIKILINLVKIYRNPNEHKIDKTEFKILIGVLSSIIIFFSTNVLYGFNIINTDAISMLTFLGFVIGMFVFMAYRFSIAYIKIEKISNELIKVDKLKDEFLVRTSHELKTPLHGIINISESLAERQLDNLANNKDLLLIKNIGVRMSSLIDDILDLTRIKSDDLLVEITYLNLKSCVSIAVDVFNHIIRGKNIIFINEVEENCTVLADERRLRQILYNLINNAIRYTDQGYIKISSKKSNGNIYVYVEDSGSGIQKDRQSKIFQDYEKFNSVGMGLGLFITSELLKKMDGYIYLDWSEEGKGSRFIFSLPTTENSNYYIDKQDEIDLKYSVSKNEDKLEYYNGFDSSTILIVDDEIPNIYVALNILCNEGYNLLSALSGEEALNKIEENRKIDLIILDIMMPKISGIEVCRKIREKYSLIDLPILICTARNSKEDFLIGFEAGANDFITKPFDAKEIKARVRTLITMKDAVKDALKSELAFLQSQIKPHFLYNAINTIIFFCYTDGEKAANLLTDFSKYLRLSFDVDKSEEVTIKRELELTEAYVSIEKARFGDKIKVEYNIEDHLLNAKIPVLTIQPLVENAIRHGLCKKEADGTVIITIKEDKEEIFIQIKDTGVGMSKEVLDNLKNTNNKKNGVGFSNVNKRISKLEGKELIIESIEGLGTSIIIRLHNSIKG